MTWSPCKKPQNWDALGESTNSPFRDPVTWYKITYAGEQVAQWASKTKAGQGGLVRVVLFWKSHCATCSPVCVILYHVT